MTISVEKLPECKARLSVEFPSSEVAAERDRISALYAAQAKLPGFRPGKAPKGAVEKRYGRQINGEVSERLVSRAIQKAATDEKVDIIGIGKVESELFGPDGSFAWAAEVVTAPEFALPDYASIPVELPRNEITDEQIESVLERMRQNHSEFVDLDDRPLQSGDIALISWTATLDGQPLNEATIADVPQLAESEEYWVKLPNEDEDDNFLPGFTDQLNGMAIGEEREVKSTMTEEFQPEELRGKELVFAVKLNGIKVQQLPEIDDTLADKISEGKTLADLQEDIREGLRGEAERMRHNLITNQILAHVGQKLDFELPPHLVFNETQRQVNDMVNESYQRGADQSLIEEHQNEILENAQARAKVNLKTTFILEKIAEAEGIRASDEELSRQIAVMAARSNRPVKKVMRELRENNGFNAVRHDIMIAKVLEFLRSRVALTEIDPATVGAEAAASASDES